MDTEEKLLILGRSAQYDLCGNYLCQGAHRIRSGYGQWIYPAVLPDGKEIKLFKVLLSNNCSNNCNYCANRCERDFTRIKFTPQELVKAFISLKERRLVQGLFLSSAVEYDPKKTMEDMIKAVEILRFNYGFNGYIHLKILPGVTRDYIEQAMRLADRVSVNLEAPSGEKLKKLSIDKDFDKDLLGTIKVIKEFVDKGIRPRAGYTTQFVVGPAGESDKELIYLVDRLYKELGLKRAYYSAFQPIKNTPLEDHPPTPLIREHRLYQADFLLRDYGFSANEFVFDREGKLFLPIDPKLAWAMNHPEYFPVEINTADITRLLRVPGIGPKSARRIIEFRKKEKIKDLETLKGLGVVVKRAKDFVLLNGKRVKEERYTQLSLISYELLQAV
ncbi:putative DNA modification/repair radical SAM protein [bacterium]|nr:putative DNA modification/repair radical SAM protein [bacterium]